MLEFQKIEVGNALRLRMYYSHCSYRLCEYSLGVKLMWEENGHPAWAESHGCLLVRSENPHGGYLFDYPVPRPGEGDVSAALDDIDAWCRKKGIAPTYDNVPPQAQEVLLRRYPYALVERPRMWQDYLYRAEDLASFAGRRYAGQRNHIHKFHKLYPNAFYRPLTAEDGAALDAFWAVFHREFHKESGLAKMEVCYAQNLMRLAGTEWFRAGGVELDGRLIAITLGEICGETLICHVEKALLSYEGIYPFLVQSFVDANRAGVTWINREDDAGDRGLRTSKLQYRPMEMGEKLCVQVRNELAVLDRIPVLHGERLTLNALRYADCAAYNRLCLDEDRNRWWGYDYREDLKGPLTERYFFNVARLDFTEKRAVNFAIRREGQFIGEVVLYNFDCRGSAELGCRILPEFAGHGYGREAFRIAAEWSLYRLGLYRLIAKCFKQNEPSRKMLAACMYLSGEDETYFYFEKKV